MSRSVAIRRDLSTDLVRSLFGQMQSCKKLMRRNAVTHQADSTSPHLKRAIARLDLLMTGCPPSPPLRTRGGSPRLLRLKVGTTSASPPFPTALQQEGGTPGTRLESMYFTVLSVPPFKFHPRPGGVQGVCALYLQVTSPHSTSLPFRIPHSTLTIGPACVSLFEVRTP